MNRTRLRHITILPMILALAHTGILGVRPSPDINPAPQAGTPIEAVRVADDVQGRGWLEKLACVACFSAVVAASTATLGGAAVVGGLAMCGMVCYYML